MLRHFCYCFRHQANILYNFIKVHKCEEKYFRFYIQRTGLAYTQGLKCGNIWQYLEQETGMGRRRLCILLCMILIYILYNIFFKANHKKVVNYVVPFCEQTRLSCKRSPWSKYSFSRSIKLMPTHMENPSNLNKVEEDTTGSWSLKQMRDKCVTVQCPWQWDREISNK